MRLIFLLVALTALALSGCADTTVYFPNGRVAMHTQADMTDVTISSVKDGYTFHAGSINHSAPMAVQGQAVGGAITAAAAAATAFGAVIK